MTAPSNIPDATALSLTNLIAPTEGGIASRVLARSSGGNVTLFAFDAGESLSEHTTPYAALLLTLDGALTLTIGGVRVETGPGSIVRLPANVPHSVHAVQQSRMLLIMLKELQQA